MWNSIVKFVGGMLLGVAVALLVAFNALLLWVATGPRSLDVLSPYIEDAFAPADQSYSVVIGETWLIWDGWKHPLDIRLRDVAVLTKEKQTFSNFPEISLGLDLLSLARGQLLPTSLTITHPVLSLYQNDDRSISFGFRSQSTAEIPGATLLAEASVGDDVAPVPLAAVIAQVLSTDAGNRLRKLHQVSMLGADVSVGNRHKAVFFKASDANIVFKSNSSGVQASGNAKISYEKYESQLSAQFAMRRDGATIEGEVAVSQLMPGILANLFADKTVLGALKFPVSGKSRLSIGTDGTLQRLAFDVDGGKGTIETDKLDGVVPVTSLHAEGQLSNNMSDIQISKLSANLGGMLVDGDGVVSLVEHDAAIRANVYTKNIPAAKVHLFWPPGVAPMSREWVTSNISGGTSPQGEAHFKIAFGDLAKPALPKEDVDATIVLEGAKIQYLPGHPEVSDIKGSIHIDGVSLQASIDLARYMKDTKMSGGSVEIADLIVDNPYIKVSFDADTSARDVVKFLGLPRLKHAQRLNLHEESAEGTMKGHAAVGFSFMTPRDANGKPLDSDISYDVKADVQGIGAPDFMNKFDIKNGAGAFTVNNEKLEFKGSASVNGANVSSADVQYLFKAKNGFDTLIEANATAPIEALPRFGYPAFSFIKGALGVKASVKEGDGIESSQATLDLTHASVALSAIHWNKPDLEPATLELVAEKKGDVSVIPSFHLKGTGIDIHGSAELTADRADIKHIATDIFIHGDANLDQVLYEHIDGGYRLELRGKTADLGPWMDSGEDSTFSFQHFPALQLTLDVQRMLFGKGRELANVKGSLTCDAQMCSSASIAGMTGSDPFSFRILRNPAGKRQLSLHAKNAGAFLKATDLFDGMEGGDLTITGTYGDHGLDGMLDITDHTIKNAPILGKILSLASFTGFIDTLRGNGIHFVRLRAPFTLENDVITLKDAKTHGDALGMTVGGTITFPKRTLDLQGTIVPSYTLNNVLGKVPLVGNMLTGGEGQGVFAARYSVRGSDKAPDVSVNPLSILTPGFLRGMFDILDTSAPKKAEEPEAEPAK